MTSHKYIPSVWIVKSTTRQTVVAYEYKQILFTFFENQLEEIR